MNRAARGGLAVLLLAGASALPAQDPEDRLALDRLRDSIAASVDTVGLLTLEAQGIVRAQADRDEPMHHLRLGLIALRLAELRPGTHLDDAIGEFEWAAELRPDWPWPWYALGLAESRAQNRAAGFAGGLWTMLGLDRDRLAGAAFARAVGADPNFVAGLVEFARIALDQRIDAPVRPALEALRAATATPVGWHPDLLLARGRLERLAGYPDSALIAFERALLLGRRPALLQLELARTLPLVASRPAAEAARHYYQSADTDDREVVAMLRRDLEPIARPGELEALGDLAAEARVEWLTRYWDRLGAVDLRGADERLAEHFRRWDVARRDFRLPPFRRRYRWGLETYQSGDAELDDRGVIWVRHGPPTLRIEWPRVEYLRPPERRTLGNESWRYDRPEGALVLHFTAPDDPQDYRVVETPRALDIPLFVLESRAHELPGVGRLIRAGRYTTEWVSEEVRAHGRASMAIATQTTGWGRYYPAILTGRSQWLAAGTRDGQPLAHLIYAVDADSLRRFGAETGQSSVPLRVRASVLDRNGTLVATLDTVQIIRVPGPSVRLVAARVEVPVRPGLLRIRYGVEADSMLGVVYPVDSIVAPRVTGRRLDASALLIGREGVSLPWLATDTDTAWLDAGGIFGPTDTLAVYAEAYGLTPGAPVTVSITLTRQRTGLARLFGSRSEAIALSERLVAPSGPLRVRRQVGLGGLEPGTYAVDVVIGSAGQEVRRRRGVVIRP